MSLLRPLHIVQFGPDDSVFQQNAPSDTMHRQLWYGELLARKRPGSHLTCLILTRRKAEAIHRGNVSFLPVHSFPFLKGVAIWQALSRLHREREIDVVSPQAVDSAGWMAPIFGKLYAVPSVAQIHYDLFSPASMRDQMGTGVLGWIRKKMTFYFLRKFFAIRVVGRRVGEQIDKSGFHGAISVIPVPVTLLQEKRQLNLHEHATPRVLFVGRLSPEKNLFLWLDAAKQIHEKSPEVQFDIVGDGPESEKLKKKAREWGLEQCVRFHGSVPYERLVDFYRSASVFLLTSNYEGFGRVLVEACAYGLPPVAPRISGVEDIIVDQETGFLYMPGNTVEMTAYVLKLLASSDLRRKVGKAGDEYVSRTFDPNKLAEEWVDCLIQAAAGEITMLPPWLTFKRR